MNHPSNYMPTSPFISFVSIESTGASGRLVNGGNPSFGTTWPTSGKAIYVPFSLRTPILVTKLWTANATNVTDNRDVGIYDINGTLIVSTGATAGSGTNAMQFYDITDTLIGPGQFYLALANNGTTSVYVGSNGNTRGTKAMGILEQASAYPLPATATFATVSQAFIPSFGLSIL